MFYEYSTYHYDHLTIAYEKKIYNDIYEALKAREECVAYDGRRITLQRFHEIFSYVYQDHPSFFYVNPYRHKDGEMGDLQLYGFDYVYDKQMSEQHDRNVKKVINYVFEDLDIASKSTYERIIALHDWIVKKCKYDPVVANGGKGRIEDYNIMGVFGLKKAVCTGFSLVFKLLCDYAHIPCTYAEGILYPSRVKNHIWNVVEYNGQYYHIDLTQDLCDNGNILKTYSYFMVNDEWISKDRVIVHDDNPVCYDLSHTYFEYKGYCVNSTRDLTHYFYNKFMYRPNEIVVYIRNSEQISEQLVKSYFISAYNAYKQNMNQAPISVNSKVNTHFRIIDIILEW